jgi:hypothetical protein
MPAANAAKTRAEQPTNDFPGANALEKPALGQSLTFPAMLVAVRTPRTTRIPISQPSSIKKVQRTATARRLAIILGATLPVFIVPSPFRL